MEHRIKPHKVVIISMSFLKAQETINNPSRQAAKLYLLLLDVYYGPLSREWIGT
jgi:hypothetical protein